MLRKIIPVFCLLMLAATFSCTDNDPVAAKKTDPIVAPPPRILEVNAKLAKCLSTQTANIYVRVNGGSWTLINSVTSTICDTIGSFSAYNGDFVEFMVLDAANPSWTAEYRAKSALSCPTTSWPALCGDGTFGTIFGEYLSSSDPGYAITVSVSTGGTCGSLIIC